jgi:hypothetical protein
MGLLMLLAATISAAAGSQGNTTNVKIEMIFDKPTKTQSLQAVISQLSSSAFQIAVDDEHQACQLARTINSDLSLSARAFTGKEKGTSPRTPTPSYFPATTPRNSAKGRKVPSGCQRNKSVLTPRCTPLMFYFKLGS